MKRGTGIIGMILGLAIIFQQIFNLIMGSGEWYVTIIISIIGIITFYSGMRMYNYKNSYPDPKENPNG